MGVAVERPTMNERGTGYREAGTVGHNAVRLNVGRAEQVVEALNVDLAGLWVLAGQLRKHRWTAEGPAYVAVRQVLDDARARIERGIDSLAERVLALGGVPVNGPAAIDGHSRVPHEGEDVYGVRRSLQHDLDAFGDLIESVGSHVPLAESLGDLASGELLRALLVDLERGADALDRVLAPGPGEPGR